MIPDNSDTTHIDTYPVKRAWNRLPWWVRAGQGFVLPLLLGVLSAQILSAQVQLPPQSGREFLVLTLLFGPLLFFPVGMAFLLKRDPLPPLPAAFLIMGSSAPLVILASLVWFWQSETKPSPLFGIVLIPFFLAGLGFIFLMMKVSFRSAKDEAQRPEPPRLDDLDS